MADRLKAEGGRGAKRLLLTTADTEILAAAKAAERLPDGFPPVRCANPTQPEDPAPFPHGEPPGPRAARAAARPPAGVPPVRCATPATLEDPAAFLDGELPGARAVMVRLLGGRRAWPAGLEDPHRRRAGAGGPLPLLGA